MTAARRCGGCREEVPEDAAFCPWCGASASRDPESTAIPAPPPPRRGGSSGTRVAGARARPVAEPPRRRHRPWLVGAALAAGAAAGLALLALRTARAGREEAVPHPFAAPAALLQAGERLNEDGDPVAALRELGALRLRTGESGLAATWLQAAAAAGAARPAQERAILLADAAAALMMAGRDAEAGGLLDEALRMHPDCAPALRHRALVRLRQGLPHECLADLAAAAALQPLGVGERAAAAHAHLALGRVPQALAEAEQALALDASSPLALHAAGCAALAAGDGLRAGEHARRADAAAPGRPEIAALLKEAAAPPR